MHKTPPCSKSEEILVPKRRLRSATIRGGWLKAADRIAPRGKRRTGGCDAFGAAEACAALTLVILMSVGLTATEVTAGRPIGGYAPRPASRWTTSASPGGSFDARSTSRAAA